MDASIARERADAVAVDAYFATNKDELHVWLESSPYATAIVDDAFRDVLCRYGNREAALANMAERLDNMGRHGSFRDLAADFCEDLINRIREHREAEE